MSSLQPVLNLQLILSLILERCPGWIIEGSRKQWVLYAIRTKDLEFLRILTQTVDPFINTSEYLVFAAGIENNFHVIEYLLSLNCPIDHLKVLSSAVEKKALNNLKFFHEKMDFPIDNYNLFSSAAGVKDNIPILKYLKSHNCPISHLTTSNSAAENGALNNLKWLLKNGFLMMNGDIFYCSIKIGSLEFLEWLKGNKCPIPKRRNFLSLKKCSIATIEWLMEQGIEINPTEVFIGAARQGCLDKMEWLLETKYSIKNPKIFEAAVKNGSLKILKWLLQKGCPINDSDIFIAAARLGHFDIMKWILDKKCPLNDSRILIAAAEFGSIEQMEWLLDNKCPIDNSYIFQKAAEKGNVKVMEWLFEKGCPTDYSMRGAAKHGCLTIMKWLLKKGCAIDDLEIMSSAVEYGSLRNMKWLLKSGCPVDDPNIFVQAAKHGSLDIMKWLLRNKFSIDDPNIMKAAAKNGSLVNLKWLLENKCPMTHPSIFVSALYHGSLRNLKWLLENKCPVGQYRKSKAKELFGSFEKLLQLLKIDSDIYQ